MLKVGLLGARRFAGVHAIDTTFHPKSGFAAISDFCPETVQKPADQSGTSANSTDDIISDASTDAVFIGTPKTRYPDLKEAAPAARNADLCEKPVDPSLERTKACLANTSGCDRPIMIDVNCRFDPNFDTLKSELNAGEIGKPEFVAITSSDPVPPVRLSGTEA